MANGNRKASRAASVHLEVEQVERIRHALLIGLAAYGEIERLQNAQELASMSPAMAEEMKDQLQVLHPTGQAETVGEFAAALREIEGIDATVRGGGDRTLQVVGTAS